MSGRCSKFGHGHVPNHPLALWYDSASIVPLCTHANADQMSLGLVGQVISQPCRGLHTDGEGACIHPSIGNMRPTYG